MKVYTVRSIFIALSLFAVSSLPLVANDRVSDPPGPGPGRFEIFIAEHNIVFKNKNIVIKSIFKMDRDTGIVWRYRQGVDSKGKTYEEFFEVPNQ